jgi:hypothetical protein
MLEVGVEFKAVVLKNRKTLINYGSKVILRKNQRHPIFTMVEFREAENTSSRKMQKVLRLKS